MSVDYATNPGESVLVGGGAEKFYEDGGKAHSTSVKPTLILKIETGTYTNGFEVAGAADASGRLFYCGIQNRHNLSNSPYDKTTAYAAGEPILPGEFVEGKDYYLPASSLTAAVGDKLICAASGLVQNAQAFASTPLLVNVFICQTAVTSKNVVIGQFKGLRYTATAA